MIKGRNGKQIKRMMMLLEKDHENDWLKTSSTQGQDSLCFWIYIHRLGSFWYAILRKHRHFTNITPLTDFAKLHSWIVCAWILWLAPYLKTSLKQIQQEIIFSISILFQVWERIVIEYEQFVSLTVPISISLPLFALLEKEYLGSLGCTFHKDPNTFVNAYERLVPSVKQRWGPYKFLV